MLRSAHIQFVHSRKLCGSCAGKTRVGSGAESVECGGLWVAMRVALVQEGFLRGPVVALRGVKFQKPPLPNLQNHLHLPFKSCCPQHSPLGPCSLWAHLRIVLRLSAISARTAANPTPRHVALGPPPWSCPPPNTRGSWSGSWLAAMQPLLTDDLPCPQIVARPRHSPLGVPLGMTQ